MTPVISQPVLKAKAGHARRDDAVDLVFYDGECAMCRAWAGRVEPALARHGFRFHTLQSRACSGSDHEMRVHLADGRQFGGAEAMVHLARRIWWAWPLWAFYQLPGARSIVGLTYRFVAARRHCVADACSVAKRGRWLDWFPLVLLPASVLLVRNTLPSWVFMWLLALAIFLGCKWLTWRRALAAGSRPNRSRSFAYLVAWPGMNANEFLNRAAETRPRVRDWTFGAMKTVSGGALVYMSATRFSTSLLLTGWAGMLGVVLLLHFGLFHLLALFWQSRGIRATPLMRSPLFASSLSDFWGSRWNTAFHTLAHDFAFRPFARRFGRRGATLSAFLISGLIHDLVISLPARGGYGLPTLYFLLQGAAVLFERSSVGRALGLGRGWRGWLFTLAITATPAFCLFHPAFVRNVILPMLNTIGSTAASL